MQKEEVSIVGSSIYIEGENKNIKPTFRLQPKEPNHLEDAPDAPTAVQTISSEQPSIDIQESSKPRARPRSKKAKEAPIVNGQKQVTQTTTEKFVAPVNGNGHAATAFADPAPSECEKLINAKTNDDSYSIVILNIQTQETIPVNRGYNVKDILAFIRSRYGNGSYGIKVLRNGVPIETDAGYMRMMVTDAPTVARNSVADEVDVVAESKKRVAVKKADVETAKADAELQEIKDRQEEEKQKREKAKNAPPEVAALQKQLDEMKALLEKKTEKAPTLIEQIKELSPLIIALAPLFKPEKKSDDGVASLVQEMRHGTEKMLTQMSNSQEKMMLQITNRLEKLEDKKHDGGGLKEQIENVMMISELIRPKDEDDFEIDPENPISSLIGGIAKVGFKAIRDGGKTPEVRQLLGAIAQRMGKQPEELDQNDMTSVSAELQAMQRYAQQNPPQLPAPVTLPPMPKLVPLQPPVNLHGQSISGLKVQPNPIPSSVVATEDKVPEEITPPSVAPVAQPETPKPTAETAPAELFEEPAISQADVEDDLRDSVTQTVRLMAIDLDAKRDICKWWDQAFGEWPKSFIDKFCAPHADFLKGKLEALEPHCVPKVFAELVTRLQSESNLMNFNGSCMRFIQYRNAPETIEQGAA